MKTKIELTENAEMLVDANVKLPDAAKNVLGALIFVSGAYTEHRKENNDWFYKDADSLIKESQVSKRSFFRSINLLEANSFIERKSGSLKKGENKVTLYKVLNGVNIISNGTPNGTLNGTPNGTLKGTLNGTLNGTPNGTPNGTLEESLMAHKNKESSIKNKESSIKNKELINKIEKDIINIIKEINLIKEEIELRKEEIPNNTEKTKTAMDTNIELSTINERLNNCAKYYKQMMQTINELQLENNEMKQAIKELQVEVKELKAKLNQDASNQDSSTSSKSTSTVGTSNNQDKSDSKPSNGSSLPTTHQDDLKPTESDSEASTPIVEDVEGRIDNFIQDFNEKSDLKPSNEQSGIVAHTKDEKPIQGKETASTAISEDNATTSNDVDDLFDGIIISGKASKKDESKHSDKGTDCTQVQSEDTKQDDSKEVKDLKMPKTVEGCFQRYIESVEDLTNPTKADLNWRKDCITQSCEKEGFDESFIQGLKSKIDKYNEEKALKVEDSSKDEEDEAFREDTASIQDKSSTTNEKPSSGTTIPKDEEKLTEAQQMPSNGKELRYLDRNTGKQYATEAEAQNDGANPMFLYDTKVGRCVFSYTSPVSHSNEQSGIVAHQDDLKPTEGKEMASTAISEDNATASNDVDDSIGGDFISEPIPTQAMAIAV